MRYRVLLGGMMLVANLAILSAEDKPVSPAPEKKEAVAGPGKPDAAAGKGKKVAGEFPEFKDVAKAVGEQFASQPGYKPGDILSLRDVQPVFPKIEKLGWKVADQQEILKQVLPDNDYLVSQLRTPQGRKSMKQIGLLPMSYDYLDRLRAMPHGSYRIRELVQGVDGYKMIEYMSTTPNGQTLTRQLSQAQNGQDFTKPTGRLYNEPLFLARLQASYDAEAARLGKNQPRTGHHKKAPVKAPAQK